MGEPVEQVWSPTWPLPPASIATALVAFGLRTVVAEATAKIVTKAGKEFTYKYANLADVWPKITDELKDVGLGLSQAVTSGSSTVEVWTMLVHKDGSSWMTPGPFVLPAVGDPREIGTAVTYARRYAAFAALSIAVGGDDDDAAAASAAARRTAAPVAAASGPRLANAKQLGRIHMLYAELDIADPATKEQTAAILALDGPLRSHKDLTAAQASKVITTLEHAVAERDAQDAEP